VPGQPTAARQSSRPRSQGNQLGPVAHQLPQFPGPRRSDPRLGQPAQAQHVRQVDGVPLVVLDPPLAPIEPWGLAR
jgi:hypothetical protein